MCGTLARRRTCVSVDVGVNSAGGEGEGEKRGESSECMLLYASHSYGRPVKQTY